MAESTLREEKHEWSAPKVRDTFLEYFKQKGHTFGKQHFHFPIQGKIFLLLSEPLKSTDL